ncbi:hypothetical protein [Pedobacter sp.]|uniref:hypothetical protein n=1 Tax=Pedobacter sp. TaxID=1411316 RepID=UPI003BAA1276
MAQGKSLSESSLEELKTRKKNLQHAAIVLGMAMFVCCISLVYFAIHTQNTSLIAVALGCSVTFLPMLTSLRNINTEIKARIEK